MNRDAQIARIREFNRFYTNILGLLDRQYLGSGMSLTEVRVLHHVCVTGGCTPSSVTDVLSMDAGYLSRTLGRLEREGLVVRGRSEDDGRCTLVRPTPEGERKLAELNRMSDESISRLISGLDAGRRRELVSGLSYAEVLLTGGKGITLDGIRIRNDVRPGDLGGIVAMHGRIYGEEFEYTPVFETYIAKSLTEWYGDGDPRGRLWLAEHDDMVVGTIGVIDWGDRAQIRWLVVDPMFRGIGLGRDLFDRAMDYIRGRGFRQAFLLTTDDCIQAIAMYERSGFRVTDRMDADMWRPGLKELELTVDLG